MKLYWGPHTCAIGIHILLEEAGATYRTEQLDVAGGATHDPSFLAVNPKGKVPTIVRDDGSVLTEFGAIATWIARAFPKAKLLPTDLESEARAIEMLEYVEGTVHGQGFGPIFRAKKLGPQEAQAAKEQGQKIVTGAFAIIDKQLQGRQFAAGDSFTIADAALFYVERWAPMMEIGLPTNLESHLEKMIARPSVANVRKLWGEA
jgi:glutathione S-transferase